MDAIFKENPSYRVLGRQKLKQILKGRVTPAEIDAYIDSSELHQTHARAPTKTREFKRITAGPNEFQIDVVVYKYKGSNGGKDRFLLMEDIISRKAWAYVLPSNKMDDVLVAYTKFANEIGKQLISVEGDDFFSSKSFLEYNEKQGIRVSTLVAATEHMVPGGGDKLGLIDRLCRTLKDILGKLIKVKGNTRWTGFLQDAVDLYNSTPHKSLHNRSPNDVYNDPEAQANKMDEDRAHNESMATPKFSVGDQVRVRLPAKKFDKEGQLYSDKIHRVTSVEGNRYRVDGLDNVVQENALRKVKDVKRGGIAPHAKKRIEDAEGAAKHARKLARENIDAVPLAKGRPNTRSTTKRPRRGNKI